MLNPYTLNIQESFKHAWHWGIGILRCLAAKVLRASNSITSTFDIIDCWCVGNFLPPLNANDGFYLSRVFIGLLQWCRFVKFQTQHKIVFIYLFLVPMLRNVFIYCLQKAFCMFNANNIFVLFCIICLNFCLLTPDTVEISVCLNFYFLWLRLISDARGWYLKFHLQCEHKRKTSLYWNPIRIWST